MGACLFHQISPTYGMDETTERDHVKTQLHTAYKSIIGEFPSVPPLDESFVIIEPESEKPTLFDEQMVCFFFNSETEKREENISLLRALDEKEAEIRRLLMIIPSNKEDHTLLQKNHEERILSLEKEKERTVKEQAERLEELESINHNLLKEIQEKDHIITQKELIFSSYQVKSKEEAEIQRISYNELQKLLESSSNSLGEKQRELANSLEKEQHLSRQLKEKEEENNRLRENCRFRETEIRTLGERIVQLDQARDQLQIDLKKFDGYEPYRIFSCANGRYFTKAQCEKDIWYLKPEQRHVVTNIGGKEVACGISSQKL